ncbi:sterol desaturase family protein [Arcticibacterium luteifluviistationis]|uniref:Sterol desaturase n=1 Tax=Arcticibacterium luteifluviistationis TaxID=1784714 RepID=A0A2Z4GE12_9BACT|nr:sterol desaturase family protein [Arcticibacterium luteifluviistationis]AWV99381.1 sterol desaturase [Arcticibacterium luteifluviistationis]
MENIINYFGSIPTLHRTIILVGGIAFFWILESVAPLFDFKYKKTKHAGLNIFFTLTTILVNFPLAFILVKSSDWAVASDFGIINWLPEMPIWAYALLGLMLLDLIGAYFIHWLEHQVKWMWMFHLIHHSDLNVDTTSANRHHPGESVFRFIFTTIAVVITGAPMWMVFMYQSISVVLSQFNHANISLPKSVNNILSYFIVTPNMHHVHHHYTQPYTDSNYGNIFAIWDRVFGTFRNLEKSQLIYGIDTYMSPEENEHIGPLLKIPFGAYREPENEKFKTKQ